MSPTCHKFNEICQLKINEGRKGTWLIYIAWKKEVECVSGVAGPTNSDYIIIILSFLRLSFALHVASSSSTVDGVLLWSVCLQTALVTHHAGLQKP